MIKRAVAAGISLAFAVLIYFLLPAECPEPAKRAASVFILAAFFWGFEIIPLYATSILVVLLFSFLLGPADRFFKPFSHPVIILFFGGFVLARAFHKYEVDRWIAARLVRAFGSGSFRILLGMMTTTALLSMWISNTATAAIMLTMARPLFLDLNKSDKFRKALVLAIAFAANIGGIATPVGTPPNAIALGILANRGIHIPFVGWMMVCLPLAVLLVGFTSVMIYKLFPPQIKTLRLQIESGKLTKKAYAVAGIGLFTVLLWLTSAWHKTPESLVALLAAGLLACTGLFDREDVKQIEWDVLILMWGGLALGDGIEASGLAKWIVSLPLFAQQGFGLLLMLCLASVFLSTFMSNTAAVNLLAPIAAGLSGDPAVLVVLVALSSSFDIALPISTPPMTMAYGTREITVGDMLKVGILFTLVSNVLILLGFQWGIMYFMGYAP